MVRFRCTRWSASLTGRGASMGALCMPPASALPAARPPVPVVGDGHEGAVKQHHRFAAAVDLVVHVESIDWRVARRWLLLRRRTSRHERDQEESGCPHAGVIPFHLNPPCKHTLLWWMDWLRHCVSVLDPRLTRSSSSWSSVSGNAPVDPESSASLEG